LDKAPDAFRTISEVADDLDIPQHVLRFWETRFAQIKPMKRSGGRRYYRPADVYLLRGIRRLLYGEGYTIRGVQRILREHGIKSVQGLIDGTSSIRSFTASDESASRGPADDGGEEPEIDSDADGDEDRAAEAPMPRRVEIGAPTPRVHPAARPQATPMTVAKAESAGARKLDTARLETVVQELIVCRQLLDSGLKEG